MRVPAPLTALVLSGGLLFAIPGTASAQEPAPSSPVVTNPVDPAAPTPEAPVDPVPVPPVPVAPIEPPAVSEPAQPTPPPATAPGVTPAPSSPPPVVQPTPVRTTVVATPDAVATPSAETPTPGATGPSDISTPLAPADTSGDQPAVLDRAVVGEAIPSTPSPSGGASQVAPAGPTGSGTAEPGTRSEEPVAQADARAGGTSFSLRYVAAALLGVVALGLAVAIGAVLQPRGARRSH